MDIRRDPRTVLSLAPSMNRNRLVMVSALLGTLTAGSLVFAENCPDAPPMIPIAGSIGPDGAWHAVTRPTPVLPLRREPCAAPTVVDGQRAAHVVPRTSGDPDRNAPIIDDAAPTLALSHGVSTAWYAPIFAASDSMPDWAEAAEPSSDGLTYQPGMWT